MPDMTPLLAILALPATIDAQHTSAFRNRAGVSDLPRHFPPALLGPLALVSLPGFLVTPGMLVSLGLPPFREVSEL